MASVYFYSDESGQATGRYFVVAGLALQVGVNRHDLAEELKDLENEPNGFRNLDWHGCKDHRSKRRYLQKALAIPSLEGRLFSVSWPERPESYFAATAAALRTAMRAFAGDAKSVIHHEGFTRNHRDRLGHELAGKFEVRAGHFKGDPIVRLADRMAGCLGVTRFGTEQNAVRFSNVPLERIRELVR